VEQPDDDRIWQAIVKEIDRPAIHRRRLFQIAAAIAFLITLGGTVMFVMTYPSGRQPEAWQTDVPDPANHETRLFSLAVMESMKKVESAPIDSHSYREMTEQLKEIDRDLGIYSSDLKVFGNQPRILKAIIRCYELKIKIIERTLSESAKNQHHEKHRNLL
jgi:hypothetical protein